MTHKRNTEGLSQSAQQKSELALERTNKAISLLLKSGKTINFHTVAEAAEVSIAYLYKHEEIKQRIDQLRKQQSSLKRLPQKPAVSDDAKKTINPTLKLRIRELEAEVRGLRNHIEVIQGIALQVPDLNREIESLHSENSRLNVEINELKLENSRMKERLNANHVSDLPKQSVAPKNKVNSLTEKRATDPTFNGKIKDQLIELGISFNSTLAKTINSAPEQLVRGAIEALKEAMASGNISKPGGWLNKAIKEGWIPSEKHLHQVEYKIFNEWFDLAKKQGLIMASAKGDDGKLYVFTRDGSSFPFEQMLAEYPVDTLRRKLEASTL